MLSLNELATVNESQAASSNLSALQRLLKEEDLPTLLSSSLRHGLSSKAAADSSALFGSNYLPSPPPATFLSLLVDSIVDDGTVQILIVSAIVSLAVGTYDDPVHGWIEGVAILAAVAIVALVTATNDYQKERQFRALDAVAASAKDVKVMRNGTITLLTAEDVVVGDIVQLAPGDKVPADAVLVQTDAAGLQIDESSLTGEAEAIAKNTMEDGDPFALSGCNVVDGSGMACVIAVGRNSQWGKIKLSLEKEQTQTPLQEKLDNMAARKCPLPSRRLLRSTHN
jgi:magnesium-transporting ATPase (P-type)